MYTKIQGNQRKNNNEKQNLISKGDAYKKYQETTSSFIPLPPKKYLS